VGYFEQLEKAADWLAAIQNPNKGWGMSSGQWSSIVNTAEAIYVLTRARKHQNAIDDGLEFIQSKLFSSIEKQGRRTRYVIFALMAAIDQLDRVDPDFASRCAEWLIKARNRDGGWGHNANDEQSRLFPTCMSLIQLAKLNYNPHDLESGFIWLLSKSSESGWSFEEGGSPTPTASAQAILALRNYKEHDDGIFSRPKELLLHTTQWGTERENLPGTLWDHCSYMWVFPALASLDVNPYDPTIAQGVRAVNKLNCNHGWIEPLGGESVRGQFWAVFAFDALHKAFDPAIHIYRIDSEKAQAVLTEPEFVVIKVRSSWAIIIPKFIYQSLAYILLLASFVIFLGLNRLIPAPPRPGDFFISVLCFVLAYILVTKRKHLFHVRAIWIFTGIIAVLGFIDLVFGLSVQNLFEAISKR
jgi:hypothetical protein